MGDDLIFAIFMGMASFEGPTRQAKRFVQVVKEKFRLVGEQDGFFSPLVIV